MRGRRWMGPVVAAAVLAAAAIAVVLGDSPPPPVQPPDFDGRLRWIARLIDAPARGAVAGDPSFTRALTERVEQAALMRGGEPLVADPDGSPGQPSARVLFADDLDTYRVALLALRNDEIEDDRRRYALTYLLWLFGPRGAAPETLALAVDIANRNIDTGYRLDSVSPVASAMLGDPENPVWVLVGPPECELATSTSDDLAGWSTDSTGYLARFPRYERPLYWRATCEGVIREERPAPRPALSERELDWLMANAVGEPDREQLGYQVSSLVATYGSELLGPGEVVFAGNVARSAAAASPSEIFAFVPPAGEGPIDPTLTVVLSTRARGGLLGSVSTIIRTGPDETWHIEDTVFAAPANRYGLIGVRLQRWRGQVLVLAGPEAGTSVRILGRDGSVLDEAPLNGRPVILAPGPNGPLDDLRIESLDATGARVTIADLADTSVQPDHISAWDL